VIAAVVFDLDGTLVDSTPDIAAAVNHTLARRGLEPLQDRIVHELTGHGADELVRRCFAERGVELGADDLERETRLYLERYDEEPAARSTLFEDAAETLPALAARGVALAVCTNKETELARRVMTELGVETHFAAVVGLDATPGRKPDPRHLEVTLDSVGAAADEAVYVGDTEIDARAAEAAGMRCIMVDWGTGRDTEAPVWARIGRFAQLVDLVEAGEPAASR
jgi:phosphoglycolate phosphatase